MSTDGRRPTPPPDHTLLAAAWALRVLDADDEAEFLAHLELEGCADCAAVVAETSATLADVAGAVPQYDPPPHLRGRLMAAVERERDEEATRSAPPVEPTSGAGTATVLPWRRRLVRRTLTAVAAAAAVVAIGGLAVTNQDLRAERDTQAAAAAQYEEMVSVMRDAGAPGAVSAPLSAPDGTLVGLVVEREQGADLLVSGLGINRGDETYVLWALSGPQSAAVGTFDVPADAVSVSSVPSTVSAGPVQGFAVSLEPGRTAPAAPTRIVASGEVGR